MADARVTTAQENPLCTRLKEKFDGRGVGRANVQTGTFERVRTESKTAQRAKAVANPFEETAQYVRAEAKARDKAAQTVRFEKISKNMDAAAAKRRVEAYEVSTPFASGAYSAAYARAAEIRARAYDGSEAREACRREARRNEKKKGPIPFTPKWFRSILVGNEEEEFVKKAPVSASLVIGILLFCAVVMMIVFSFAQISEFKKEIASLEAQKAELTTEIAQITLDIDVENDIRKIEKIATEEIGMVKSNRVESRYISVADGERVVVTEEKSENAEDYGIFSGMMSSVQSNWSRLMEYID